MVLRSMDEENIFEKIVELLQDYNNNKSDHLVTHQSYDALSTILDVEKESVGQWGDIYKWVEQYLKYSINTSNPNFVNRMWSGANLPSIIGEVIVAATNTSTCTYESAPVATILERYMINEMLALVGFENGSGQMTTGSSNGNMISMMVARNRVTESVKKEGLFSHAKLFAFVNEDAHYSLDKAANIIGIGTNQLVKIKTHEDGSIVADDLEKAIEKVIQADGIPFYVCATLGTTVKGAFDSISNLVGLRDKYKFWLHGDGAWGGASLVSDRLKDKLLKDVEQLDSFTMDFHKMLGSSLMCNFLLLNHRHLLTKTCADGDNSYIFRDDDYDSGHSSLQCGRRVDSLKWFLDWKFYGKEGFSDRVENYYELAKFAEQYINKSDVLEMVSRRASFNVCFRYKSKNNDADTFINKLRETLYEEQKALLALAYVDNKLIFRLLISNTNINKETLESLFNTIENTGNRLQQEYQHEH